MPLDFALRDVSADMSYSLFRGRYEGNILLGKADTAFSGYRPFAWTAEAHFSLGRNQRPIAISESNLGALAPAGHGPGGGFQPAQGRRGL